MTTEVIAKKAQEQALNALASVLQDRYDHRLLGIVMYGSCLRSGDLFDGLVDLYVVIDDYSIYPHRWLAVANRLLYPNVFYLETSVNERVVRSKYAVISLRDLRRGASKAFESYIWGRFAQPVQVVFSRSDEDRLSLQQVLDSAVDTFLNRALPAIPAEGNVEDLWVKVLTLSYGTELRAEGSGRASELININQKFYFNAVEKWAMKNPRRLEITCSGGENRYHSTFSAGQRSLTKVGWLLRRVWGKFLSLCRLIKGMFTFDGGLDYIAWKLERHSGQQVEIPDSVRRRPLIHVWPLAWRLYRRGIFK